MRNITENLERARDRAERILTDRRLLIAQGLLTILFFAKDFGEGNLSFRPVASLGIVLELAFFHILKESAELAKEYTEENPY